MCVEKLNLDKLFFSVLQFEWHWCSTYPFVFECFILWPLIFSGKVVIVTLMSSFLWMIQYLFLWPLCLHFQDGSYSRGPVDIAIGEYDESKYFLSPIYKFEQVCLLHLTWHFQFSQTTCKRSYLIDKNACFYVLSRIGCLCTCTYPYLNIFSLRKLQGRCVLLFLLPLFYMWMP